MSTRPDVVVVGARVAGAATALLLARRGRSVLLVDRADLPSDTVSTHQIARTGVVALHRWGLLDEVLASGAPALRQITFHSEDGSLTRTVKHRFGVDHLVAPRRYLLDAILAKAARRAGAILCTGITVDGVRLDDAGRATGVYGRNRDGSPVELEAGFVVGADGLSSRVARSVGAAVVEDRGAGGATRYAYYVGLPDVGVEFFTAERGFAGVFPTHHGESCVWLCTPDVDAQASRRASGPSADAFENHLRQVAPGLMGRLRTARRTSPVRGQLRSPNQRRQAHGPGWALVGDAGFHRDPVSAHGISDAFRDAEFLAEALDDALSGDATALARYETQRDEALREVFDLTCALVRYPAVPEFVDLMRRLGTAIDTEAALLAARPRPEQRELVPVTPTHPATTCVAATKETQR